MNKLLKKKRKGKAKKSISLRRKLPYGKSLLSASGIAIVGFAIFLAFRYGISKPIINAVLTFKFMALSTVTVLLAWKVFTGKLDGFIYWLVRTVFFVALTVIGIHLLFPFLPEETWPMWLVVPVVAGYISSQISESLLLGILIFIASAVIFGSVYLATFDLHIAVAVSIPVAIGAVSGLFSKILSQSLFH